MKFIISIAFAFVISQTYSQSRTVKNSVDSRLAYQQKFPSIDKYIDSTLKEWNVPGLALTVVYKDQTIYTKGYGFRDLEKKLPVETNTLIPIASNTKLFTATLACILAEEGKLSLDKPVRNYLPSLVFSTDELNAKVTLRDMLSHRTGLPRYDGIWVNSPLTRKELLEKVTYMETLFPGEIQNLIGQNLLMGQIVQQNGKAYIRWMKLFMSTIPIMVGYRIAIRLHIQRRE